MASERKSSVVVWGVLLVAVLLATVAAADWDWLEGRCIGWCDSTRTDPDELVECKQLLVRQVPRPRSAGRDGVLLSYGVLGMARESPGG